MGRAVFEHTISHNFTNIEKTAQRSRKVESGNCNTPNEAFFIEIGLKLLVDRSLSIEEDEYPSDIEEKSPHCEVFSWADPAGKAYGGFEYGDRGTAVRELAPSPKPEYNLFRILDRMIEFSIFQEPFWVVCVWVRVDGLITEDGPAFPLVSN